MGSSVRVHPLKSPGELMGRTHSDAVSSLIPNDERNTLRSNDQNRLSDTMTVPIGYVQRDTVSRSGAKFFYEPSMDLEDGKAEKEQDGVKIQNQALVSGLAYCVTSISMILVNKLVLSGYDFNAGISLMLYQNLVSVTIVSSLSFFDIISTEPLTWKLVKVWLPVNVIFIGMLITSMFSLRYMNVAMVTILKNVTNVITALGETYIFMKHHDKKVWTALCLMALHQT